MSSQWQSARPGHVFLWAALLGLAVPGLGLLPSAATAQATSESPPPTLQVELAPFSLTETGVPEGEVRFQDATFEGGVPTQARYTFNSYRFSYRYRLRDGASTTAWVGFTIKVRDAGISLLEAL